MIYKWLIVGGAHFAVAGVLLKLLGLVLPCCVTCYYTFAANFLLYLYLASFTFDITKKWYLEERIPPENRAVFITGCDSGFGHHLAKRLDSNGYHVFAGCLIPDGVGAIELKKKCSKRLQVLEIDVTKDDSVKNAVDYVKENLGTSELWAIVNNAGILKGFEVELTSIEDFKDTFEVNAFGPVRVTKAFLPLLRQSRGRIVNVTSQGGRVSAAYMTAYVMSKFAAVAFNDCLKQELSVWGIRVISIEPEFFSTNLSNPDILKKKADETFSKLSPDVKDDYGEKYLKRFKNSLDLLNSLNVTNLDIVVNALDDAISLQYPNSVYKCNRNIFTHVLYYLAERVPLNLLHGFMKILSVILAFPKPREAENYL